MCAPAVLKYVAQELSRRDFLRLGGTVAAGTALLGAGSSVRAQGQSFRFSKLVDLTHTMGPRFPMFPGFEPVTLKTVVTVEKDGFYGQRVDYWEHSGTHMDAPAHFVKGGVSADKMPLENFVVPLAVCDIRQKARANPDAEVTLEDLTAWERANGRLPDGAFVMMNSGWDARAGDPKAYLNQDSSNTMHFPGFAPAAAEFLVKERKISGIGVDTLSLDFGAAKAFNSHVAVLGAGKYGLENVANLSNVPAVGATLIVGIPKVENASGGPVRLMAALP
jgi:kynurenine formamidase